MLAFWGGSMRRSVDQTSASNAATQTYFGRADRSK
jgi:hypothetical protein